MITVPTLETERLLLRPWRADDAAVFSQMCADAELMRYVGGVMDRPAAWRRMAAYAGQWLLRGYGPWALEDKATGQLAGYSGVFNPDGWPEPEINWGLTRPFLGRGLVIEAATRARNYAYDTLGFTTIASCIDLENKSSIAVATRLGAKLDREITFFGRPGGVFRHVAPADRPTALNRSC
jgi:RimJ/RimL family protein N-acetyltransferase